MRKQIGKIFFILLILLVPLIVRNDYYIGIFVFAGINTITVIGLTLLLGYAGQISLGHAGFYGIGAYASTLLSLRLGINPWIAIMAGMVLTGFIAFLVGYPTLKLKGHYLAMATLGIGIIINIILDVEDQFTGGADGMSVDSFTILGFELVDSLHWYILCAVLLIFTILSLPKSNGALNEFFNQDQYSGKLDFINTISFDGNLFFS